MRKIKVQCPAKINLSLKVTGKRSDGFHNIESIMQTINLYDYITISAEPDDGLNIHLSGNSSEIPYDESNLVYKAAKLFFAQLEFSDEYKVSINIEKNIPVAAGLAGGSTDAAGTLFGLNILFNEPLSRHDIHTLCAKLGSDLNFCLEGGTKITRGRGEILEPVPFIEQKLSLIKPLNFGISAKEAYTKFSKKTADNVSGRDKFVNDLEWAVIDDYKILQSVKAKYPASIMSGSGPTYYIIDGKFEDTKGFWVKNDLKTTSCGVTVVEE